MSEHQNFTLYQSLFAVYKDFLIHGSMMVRLQNRDLGKIDSFVSRAKLSLPSSKRFCVTSTLT